MQSLKPWWLTDSYGTDAEMPESFENLAGPNGLALVRAWPDGRTDEGWGLQGRDGKDGFLPRYLRGEFNPRRVLHGYRNKRWAFAFIMRSVRLVCVDIDGKNGGLEHAKRLGNLPPTLSETSKSGNGYHLFYSVDEEWSDIKGYGLLSDRIGIEQGVDIRATGCVYHHDTQRWNNRPVAPLPDFMKELLLHREQKLAAVSTRIASIVGGQDDLEVLMLHDEIIRDLAKPIPAGKRNNTLFAIGNQMKEAGISDWETKLRERGNQVGLDIDELDKLEANIKRYGGTP